MEDLENNLESSGKAEERYSYPTTGNPTSRVHRREDGVAYTFLAGKADGSRENWAPLVVSA